MFFSLPEGLKAWLIIKNTQETSVVGKLKPENKFRPELNGNRTHQLCTAGAVVLYQLRYQAHCELFTNHKMTSSQLAWSLTWKTTAPASQRGFQSRSSLFLFFFLFSGFNFKLRWSYHVLISSSAVQIYDLSHVFTCKTKVFSNFWLMGR